jgi:hypothetical protein
MKTSFFTFIILGAYFLTDAQTIQEIIEIGPYYKPTTEDKIKHNLKYDSLKKANPKLFVRKKDMPLIQMNLDPAEVLRQKEPITYMVSQHRADTADVFISSGPFHSQKFYQFSPEALDKVGFELIRETNTGFLYRFCKENLLFEVNIYFGDSHFFTVSLKKFSRETAKKIPYLAYGCN